MSDYKVVSADDVKDAYAGTDVPGEFRRLTNPLEAEQVAVTLIRVPPHSDFEQGTGHYHDEVEELYIVTRGELTFIGLGGTAVGDSVGALPPGTGGRS